MQYAKRQMELNVKRLFGAEVKRRRVDLGLSQEQLAERADLHRTYVSDVEGGKRNPSLASIERLAKALGTTLATVFMSVEQSHFPANTQASPGRVVDIILVEDSLNDIELTRTAFEHARIGNRLTVLRDGAQALDFLFRQGQYADQPNLSQNAIVLLDLHLPKIDGLEILRKLRADDRTRSIPVVVLTVSRRDEHIHEALELGADAYIIKPVNFDGLSQIGSKLSYKWALLQEQNT
jgi:CheY-like chemotaxis protein/DNA-binding XRE family transcriptional regulator